MRKFLTALLLCAGLLATAMPALALEPASRPLYAGMDISV